MTRNLLTWTIDLSAACSEEAAPHYANFGHGRYSVGKAIGSRPWYVARWHRSRRPQNYGQNITGAPTLEAAKAACEHHAKLHRETRPRKSVSAHPHHG
jgi:hypothetical protein